MIDVLTPDGYTGYMKSGKDCNECVLCSATIEFQWVVTPAFEGARQVTVGKMTSAAGKIRPMLFYIFA